MTWWRPCLIVQLGLLIVVGIWAAWCQDEDRLRRLAAEVFWSITLVFAALDALAGAVMLAARAVR